MVKPDFFFDGGPGKAPNNSGLSEDSNFIDEFVPSRDSIALAKAFGGITKGQTRRLVRPLDEQLVQR